ncbi:hypothetical protein DXG03_005577 [Asterophora parasitica]|uniref:Grap2 and cyclin-D-interacting-domain-containing protein n=1 Tax=Asterophora parasitica TaxID=117018 RepID=A0A9P7G1K2_9AGAR|nr:hypothetical protein DXG03_005577 [Asterophora parasitica]
MAASPQQLTIASLKVGVQTCLAALDLISSSSPGSDNPDPSVLYKDFISILSLLHGSTTKLSLALKPASPTYSASLTPLKDISEQISAAAHCVHLFEPTHGLTFIQEITLVTKDVIQSVKSLLQTFIDVEASGNRTSTGKAGDEYLVRVGAIHDIINNARSGLSKDNIASVQKKLAQDHESLEDGLHEVGEMVSDHDSADRTPDDEWDDDDGWGELGIDSKKRMDADELERARKVISIITGYFFDDLMVYQVHTILRMSTLLHKRIRKDILSPPSTSPLKLPSHIIEHLDTLPPHSSALLVASDDLVSTLYAPQNPSNVSAELASFTDVVNALRSTILVILQEPTLAEHMEAMSLQGTGASKRDPRKWFETCFSQIQKAMEGLESTLNIDR